MTGYGTIAVDGSTARLRFERELAFPAEEVWAALTEPARMAEWLAKATVTPGIGGEIALDFGEGGAEGGRITAWDPPRILAYEWNFVGEQPSHVRWELSAVDERGATLLTLEHTRLEADASAGYGAGWHAHLDQLEGHLAGDVRDLTDLFETLRPHYEKLAGSTA